MLPRGRSRSAALPASRARRRTAAGAAGAALLTLALLGAAWPAAAAMRIVSLAPSVTETLFAVGAGAELVGVSTYCDFPPEVAAIDRVGSFLSPSIEVITAKRPDLVIGVPTPGNRTSVEALERLGLRVLIVDPQSVDAIRTAIERIATAVGRGDAGRALVARIDADMAATLRRLKGTPPRRVLMVVGHMPLVAVGAGVFQDELIRMARGVNLAAAAGGQWPNLSMEWVVAQRPEVIIDATMGNEEREGPQAAADLWRSFPALPAVRKGRIFGYREYAVLRPGPRIAEGFRAIAAFVHPERFREGR